MGDEAAALLDSAMWGQIDSVLALLILLVLDAFLQNNTKRAALLYGIAVMVKPQALMLGTIMLCGYALEVIENPKKVLKDLGDRALRCAWPPGGDRACRSSSSSPFQLHL